VASNAIPASTRFQSTRVCLHSRNSFSKEKQTKVGQICMQLDDASSMMHNLVEDLSQVTNLTEIDLVVDTGGSIYF
jgi:glutaredoxin 2